MITKAGKALKAAWETLRAEDPLWPTPRHSHTGEGVQFLFILTPPGSGSTALSQILNSAPGSMMLNKRAEGQWLVPGMCQSDRWDPDKSINWDSVRAVWLERVGFVQQLVGDIRTVVEKSPPNLVRLGKFMEVFPNSAMFAFNRDPYASCSSRLYRRFDPDRKSEQERVRLLERLASAWVTRSTWIKKWVLQYDAPRLTYEEFCEDPIRQVARLREALPSLGDIQVAGQVKVKDYQPQGIVNQNARQVANLSPADREAITSVLRGQEELLSFFGYHVAR